MARGPGIEGTQIRFWGVRGSYPTPYAANLGHGGNTCCVTIRYADEPCLIFDAGSGLRDLGAILAPELAHHAKLNLFFSHFHWDHIQGMTQFAPLYRDSAELVLHSVLDPERLLGIFRLQMSEPYYPMDWNSTPARTSPAQIGSDGVVIGSTVVRLFALSHPGGCSGYRVDTPAGSVVFATDHEHGEYRADSLLRDYARNADVLIYDAQYTPEEYDLHRGWGHSTWREGVRLAQAANVGRLVLFHHDPAHDDAQLRAIGGQAMAEFAETYVARENWTMEL